MPLVLFDDDPDMRYGYYWTAAALRRGVYLHPYHNMFVTPALTEADVQKTLSATDQAFDDLKRSHALIGPQANLALASRRRRAQRTVTPWSSRVRWTSTPSIRCAPFATPARFI